MVNPKLLNPAPEKITSVHISPKDGYSDTDIIEVLKGFNTEVKILAPGHISAHISQFAAHALEEIAHVRPKRKHYYSKTIEAETKSIVDSAKEENVPVSKILNRAVKNTGEYGLRDLFRREQST